MLAILALALLIRLPLLNQSLWLDESIQALALQGKMGPILSYALADFQPPLYHFVLKFWTNFFGYSEIALRTPSLLFGIASVYLIIKLATLLSNKQVGLIAGLLLATNPLHIYYSQEGRTYMLTTFLVLCSFYYLAKLLKKPSRKSSILYLLFTTLSLWSSYLSWIVVVIQWLYMFAKRKKNLLPLPVISFLTLIPWLPSVIKQLQIGLSSVAHSPQWGKVVGALDIARLPRTWIKFAFGRISFTNKSIYLIIVAFVLTYHLFHLLRARNKNTKLLLTWLLGTVTVTFILSGIVPVYQYFRLIFTLPAYLILLAIGVSKTKRPKRHTAILCALQLLAISYFWINPRFHKEDWRQLTADIAKASPANSAIAMPSLAQNAPLNYYALDLPQIEAKNLSSTNFSTIYYIKYAEELFDKKLIGKSNLEKLGYIITSESTYTSLHLQTYTKK